MHLPTESSGRSPEPVRVLLVDADARARTALRSAFTAESGFEVVGTVSGAPAALSVAVENTPVVALVDVVTGSDGSGLTLVHLLSQIPGCHVVAMSMQPGLRDAAEVAGAISFVAKGSEVETMLSAIRSASL